MIKRLVNRTDLKLVGLQLHPEKVGRDVGELAGIAPIGITATGTVDAILAARLTASRSMVYGPTSTCTCRCSRPVSTFVTTADWVTGYHSDTNHPARGGRTESEIV